MEWGGWSGEDGRISKVTFTPGVKDKGQAGSKETVGLWCWGARIGEGAPILGESTDLKEEHKEVDRWTEK